MDHVLPEEVRTLEWKDLPNELINQIVANCSGPTVLQLRLVSKTMREIVKTSKRFKEVVREVSVYLNSEKFQTFIHTFSDAPEFPFQDFYIDTGNQDRLWTPTPRTWFMDTELLNRFVERFSPTIRKLVVTRMFCGTVDGEVRFYESLVNLRELEVEWLEPVTQVRPQLLPVSGLSVKVLKVWEEGNCGDYVIDWIRSFPSLEEIDMPQNFVTATTGREAYGGATLKPDHFYPYVVRLGADRRLPNLRVLDLSCGTLDLGLCSEQDRLFFDELLTEREGFRFRRVSAKMLEEVKRTCVPPEWKRGTLDAFKRTVESLHGMHQMLQEEGFETLETLSFDTNLGVFDSGELGPLRFPGLKQVELDMAYFDLAVHQHQRYLDRLCLPEEPHWSVECLELSGMDLADETPLNPGYLDHGFPNLRSVSLDLGEFSKEQVAEVIKIMSMKPFLEEMSLTTSRGTPEDAFFGGVEDSPVLLSFPNLKKLTLKDGMAYWGGFRKREAAEVEAMSDRSLHLFGQMRLSHLSIWHRGWESVTNEGVRGLLGGTFGRTVVSVELPALKVKGDEERMKLLDEVKEVARRNKVRLA